MLEVQFLSNKKFWPNLLWIFEISTIQLSLIYEKKVTLKSVFSYQKFI